MLREIEAFLRRTGMPATRFGWEAVKDKRFVFDLRNGRQPREANRQRCAAFMALYEAELRYQAEQGE